MNKIKQFFYDKRLYKKFRFWRFRTFPPKSIPQYWIKKYLKNEPLWVVQIGSNDGLDGDPLNPAITKNDKWQSLFVEPVPNVFERLRENYGSNPRFHFEMSAINDGSEQTFYYANKDASLKDNSIPFWFDKLGSFDRDNITKYLPELEKHIEEMQIQGITFPELLKKYKVTNLQLLHIDAEGYDFKILSQVNLKEITPLIILFEHSNIDEQEKEASKKMLKDKYLMFELGLDFLCIEKGRFNKNDLKYLNTYLT